MSASSEILVSDPRRGYLAYRDEIDSAISRVLQGGMYILGSEVASFEREFAAYLGVAHAIGVASGTDALVVALKACGVGPGDSVITVSHTAVATVAAIELAGATPVLIDIDPDTFTLDASQLEGAIAAHPSTRAVIPVHLYGHPADMPSILDAASRHDLYVIEDCAQAHGASLAGRMAGTWGHMAAFSFYPTKNLGALGDGGAVATNDPSIAERAAALRQYGWRTRYISDFPGMNSRLDEIQSAVLRVKLQYLDAENARRHRTASLYGAALSSHDMQLPHIEPTVSHVYHQYTVRSGRRDQLQATLRNRRIQTAILYPLPVHLQPGYRDRCAIVGQLAQTERACREILSLPIHPFLTEDEVARVIEGFSGTTT